MSAFTWIGPLALTIAGGVVYHVSAKSLPKDLNPGLVLVGAYATALCASAIASVFLPASEGTGGVSRMFHPAILALGIGASIIELGYVLTYRAAWPVSVASILVNSTVSVLLVIVGALFFSERLSFTRALGVVLCLTGAWLLRR